MLKRDVYYCTIGLFPVWVLSSSIADVIRGMYRNW